MLAIAKTEYFKDISVGQIKIRGLSNISRNSLSTTEQLSGGDHDQKKNWIGSEVEHLIRI